MVIHKGLNILAIDLEFAQTYKKKLKKSAVMEVGLVAITNLGSPDETTEYYSKMINPGVNVSRYATKVTGITSAMTRRCEKISVYHKDIQRFIDKADIIVFHGGVQDIEALNNLGFNIKDKVIIDTQAVAKKSEYEFENYSLSGIAGYFNIKEGRIHRALDDAKLTIEVYRRL